jgi:anti-sigma factor RsiW
MNNEELYDKIEAYLNGNLSEEERAAVELEIQTNPEAALEFQWQQVELEAMEAMLERDLRSKIPQWLDEDEPLLPPENDTPSPPQTSRPGRLWIAALLGAFVVLAVVAWRMDWFNFENESNPTEQTPADTENSAQQTPGQIAAPDEEPTEPEDPVDTQNTNPDVRPAPQSPPAGGGMMAYADKFYKDLRFENVRRGAPTGEDQDPLSEAISAYQQKQYSRALQLLNAVPDGGGYATSALEMKAHTLYHLKKYKESAAAFAAVAATESQPYAERSQWNLLVCYTAQYPATKAAFDALLAVFIADSGHTYHEKALELQARLPK